MSESFESLFTIQVETVGVESLDSLILKLGEVDAKVRETSGIVAGLRESLSGFTIPSIADEVHASIITPLESAITTAGMLATALQGLYGKGGDAPPPIPVPLGGNFGDMDVYKHLMDQLAAAEEAKKKLFEEPFTPMYIRGEQGGWDPRIRSGSEKGGWRSQTGRFSTQEDVFAELAGSGKEFEQLAELSKDALMNIPEAARTAVNLTLKEFERLKMEVVGHSIIPDMVNDINRWLLMIKLPSNLQQEFQRLQHAVYVPTISASGSMGSSVGDTAGPVSTEYAQFGNLQSSVLRFAESFEVLDTATGRAGVTARATRAEYDKFGYTLSKFTTDVTNWEDGTQAVSQNMEDYTKVLGSDYLTSFFEGDKLTGSTLRYTKMFDDLDKVTGKTFRTFRTGIKEIDEFDKVLKDSYTDVKTYSNGIQEVEKHVDDFTDKADSDKLGSSRFMRHLAWIAQGILIWQGLNAINQLKDAYVKNFSDMEQAAARAAFIIDDSTQQIFESQLRAAAQATQYGIEPTSTAQAGIVAAQYGVDEMAIVEDAARLAMVAQMDMAEATDYLLSIERIWNIELSETSRVLDTLVTMYATAPGDMKGFMDMMREGPALAMQFGMSFEEYMLMIARAMSYLPGQTPSTVSGLLGRTVSRLTQGETPEVLARDYGIGVISPETLTPRPGLEVLDEIAAKYRALGTEQEKVALAVAIAGSKQGQAWQDMKVLLDNWGEGIRGAETKMRSFGDMSDNVLNTHRTRIDAAKAAWVEWIQVMAEGEGIIGTYSKAIGKIAEGLEDSTRQALLFRQAESLGIDKQALADLYEGSTGAKAFSHYETKEAEELAASKKWYEPAEGYRKYAAPTEEFMDWAEKYLNAPIKAEGWHDTGWEQGGFKDEARKAGETFKDDTGEAGKDFVNDVSDATDILTSKLFGGWTPSPSIVDLTGSKENPYTMAEVNKAIAQSRADTDRMIAAFAQGLRERGLGEDAIAVALKNFTDKMALNLQFYRLPGGEIRLMEGRDLLFYLSKIEENTRPLEGIWNVPEGMRMWVPIESTFYGNWRDKQGKEETGQTVTLDSTTFDRSAEAYASATQTYRDAVNAFKESVRLNAERLGLTESTYIPEIGWPYSAEQELEPPWVQPLMDALKRFRLEGMYKEGPVTAPQGTATGEAVTYSLPQWIIDNFMLQFQRNLDNLFYAPIFGRERPEGTTEKAAPQMPGGPETNWLGGVIGRISGIVEKFSQLFQRDSGKPTYEGTIHDTESVIPQPLSVSLPQNQLSQGVQMGTLATGMPTSMSTLTGIMTTMRVTSSAQLLLLMTIARNTGIPQAPPVVNVTVEATGRTATTTVNEVLTREWALGHGVYETPI